jgi:S-DNA-T family DNA segregation ATPase FtsK/SpoIIIE
VLVESLRQFGIEVRLAEVSQGPAITRFEIVPPPGVKVSRIVNLADDIALSLAATGVRIEAPIPGKSAIGIEVPNDHIAPVLLRDVLETNAFGESHSFLTVALGRDVAGAPIVAHLDEMPHLLVAGATGSGKSVLINVLISSLLLRTNPNRVRLLLIDPKVVELSIYNGIPHLISPVVTEPKKAAGALRWAVQEMENRYRLFAAAGVRDVTRYNQTVEEQDKLPLIVIIIDELADLMMVAPQDVEESIARLAQMARAAGLHLVVATQRPSVDVITGTIKANIPSRIAFAVSSQVDSRTILDTAGAEKLLGRGDMLFSPVGSAKPLRVQGAFVTEKEIERVVQYLRDHSVAVDPSVAAPDFVSPGEDAVVDNEPDSLFLDAVRIVVESRQASTSMLQRRMRIGYTRAARLIDAMESRGYIGPADGARPRDVLISDDQYRQLIERTTPSA